MTTVAVVLQPFNFDRAVRAVEKVKERLYRATAALEAGGVAYAVAGGNAVAAWVSRVDEAAVRATRDVDILIRRADLQAATDALATAGFVYRRVAGIDVFLDGPDGKVRDAVHVRFAGELVRPDEPAANPDVADAEDAEAYRILTLMALVQVKLTAWRDKDRTHLRDMIDVGLLDDSWPDRLPSVLGGRLQTLLDDPRG